MNNRHTEIGKKLKDYFSEKRMTQQDIATRLGVTQTAVSALLRGKPFGKKTAAAWSEQFGFDFTWLLTGQGNMLQEGNENPNQNPPQLESAPKHSDIGYHYDSHILRTLEELVRSNSVLVTTNRKVVETNEKLVERILKLTEV